jgi:N4-(beta-N-acetylglucosaminyl)-L-asparaginase
MVTFLATWEHPGQTAVKKAWAAYSQSSSLIDGVEAGLAACELDPAFLAIGLGSLPNADGELELDAAIMDGRTLDAGAVCALRGIVPAISVARKVMDDTRHVMVAGDQARRFAIAKGFEPRQTMTVESVRLYEEWRQSSSHTHYIHSAADLDDHADTVTMIGIEHGPGIEPHLVAASATSGLSWKLPGRVGDSPIVGAGIYADDEVGAAGATGLGEELWKACASFRTVEGMRRGLSPQAACEETIHQMTRRQPGSHEMACVVFAANREGEFGAAINSGIFHLWSCVDGDIFVKPFQGLSDPRN